MNYINDVSAFYEWLERHTLAPSSINLWFALMHMNQEVGGADTFSVADSVLSIKTNLTGRTLQKARKELMEKGRIEFLSRKGKAPIYKMIPFQEPNQPVEPSQRQKQAANDCSDSPKK